MKWTEIRAHYAALHAQAQAAGLTQKAIAARGGIAGQNTVSRVLSNDNLGPSVEIFVRAIEGLGKSVSEFFVELEQGAASTFEPPPAAVEVSVLDRLERIEQALEALGLSSSVSSPGRLAHGCTALSPGVVNHNHITTLDRQSIEAIVKTSVEGILAHVARIDTQMATVGAGDGEVSGRKSAARGGHRRRPANPA